MLHIGVGGARWTPIAAWAIALASGCTAGCAREDARVHLERAAVIVDAVGAPAAAYFTVRDERTRADSVTGVSADVAQFATMVSPQPHRMPTSGGSRAMLMSPVATVPLGRTGQVRFAPGGHTALLYNLQRPLAVGDSVRLTVQLQSGRTATTTAPVVAFAELERVLADSGSMPPSGGTPSLVEGKALYRSNGCITCHGPVGYGDGVVGRTLVPPPRDFRDSLAFKAGRDGAHIAKMLVLGIPAGGNMPLYAHLSNQQRASLALYVISLRDTSVSDAH